jgi:ABC-2 type transport system permease protein
MSELATAWQMAMREIRERGRSKSFLITSGLTLVLVVALILLPRLIGGGTTEYVVAMIGEGNEPIVAAAEQLGNAGDETGAEPSVAVTGVPYDDREQAESDLEEGTIDAALIDGSGVVVESVGGFGESEILSLLQRGAASVELEAIVSESGDVATDVIEVMTSDPLETTTLSGQEAGDETSGLVAYVGLFLLYLAVLLYGNWILSGVTEEKSNRVVEVLLSAVRPWQILTGKILGIGLLGMAQFAGTILVAVAAVALTDDIELPNLDVATVTSLIVWFVLGFLLYAVLYGAAGSLVSRVDEAQNVAFPLTMVAVAGFLVSFQALAQPDGPAAVVGTFIPFTAPFVVPVRAALDSIPAWEYALAVVITAASIVGLVVVAGRIYSGALLSYGGRVKLRDAWRSSG